MPERKKPSKPAPARASSKAPARAAAKKPTPAAAKKPAPAVKKPVAKKPASGAKKPAAATGKRPAAKPAPVSTRPQPARPMPVEESPPVGSEIAVAASRPIAVAREGAGAPRVYSPPTPAVELFDSLDVEADSSLVSEPSAAEAAPPRTWEELAAAGLAAVLAILVLVPWYSASGGSLGVSGWASGTWGPIIFFLALAAVGVVVIRRLNAPIRFPVESGLVIEGIAWVSIIALFIKRFLRVKVGATGFALGVTRGQTIALFTAVALALVAGRMSSNAPIMVRPGWFRDRAGKTGVAILGIALIFGLVFGFTNSAFPGQSKTQTGAVNSNVRQVSGMPQCAKDLKFPVPAGVTATSGYDIKGSPTCVVTFSTSTLTLNQMYSRFVSALRARHWGVSSAPALQTTRVLSLTKPKCGQMTFIEGQSSATTGKAGPSPKAAKKVRTATVWVGPCASPAP